MSEWTPAQLAARIDQTLLTPEVGLAEGARWLDDHVVSGFAALVVPPFLAPAAVARLAGTPTRACSVCGFPLGYQSTEAKAAEAALLAGVGCEEIDMVMNVGVFLDGDTAYVAEEISAVVASAGVASGGLAAVKVIIETGRLAPEEIATAASVAVAAGAAFVKTSTGFGPRGATVEDVLAIRAAVGPDVGVKASGGIRDLDAALAMLKAGADRIGTSSGAEIVASAERRRG